MNEAGVWPLELTCRFGYPGFAILSVLQAEPWDEVLRRLVEGRIEGSPMHDGFSVGVVLTVPPFPHADGYARLGKGLPVFLDALTDEERTHVHLGEVRFDGDTLVTAGEIGYVLVATGSGPTAEAARDAAYRIVEKIAIPNVRYRNDIGARFIADDARRLRALGWLP